MAASSYHKTSRSFSWSRVFANSPYQICQAESSKNRNPIFPLPDLSPCPSLIGLDPPPHIAAANRLAQERAGQGARIAHPRPRLTNHKGIVVLVLCIEEILAARRLRLNAIAGVLTGHGYSFAGEGSSRRRSLQGMIIDGRG